MAAETEAQNTTAKVYDFTMLLSATLIKPLTWAENTTCCSAATAPTVTWVTLSIAENSTGTVYPLTYTFGGGSGVGEL